MSHVPAMPRWRRESLARAGAAGALLAGSLLSGCAVVPASDGTPWPEPGYTSPSAPYDPWIEPAMYPVAPVYVPVAPPPPPREVVPVMPFAGAIWIGGSWAWQNQWIWAPGRWTRPPSAHHRWTPPHYERQGPGTRYVPGYWAGPRAPEHPARPFAPPRPEPRRPGPREAWDQPPGGPHPFNPPAFRPPSGHPGPVPQGPGRATAPPPAPAPMAVPPSPRSGRLPPVPATARPHWEDRAPGAREEGRNGRGGRGAPDPSDRLP